MLPCSMMPRAVASLAILGGLLMAGSPASASAAEEKAKVFVGYLYGAPRDLNYRLYTHLCHAFLTADGDGWIRPNRAIPDRKLTAEAHEAGVAVLLSLGGWGWDRQFAEITSDPEAEDRYIDAVMAAIAEGDYDGIDLDWEYPDTKDEVVGFERLSRRFRERLDARSAETGRPMRLTMAASSNPGTLRWLRPEFLRETLDWVNIMTYDYAGDWTDYAGHNAPLFASSKPAGPPRSAARTIAYLLEERGLPADHLALGIPLYGRGFAVAEPYASTKDAPKTRLPSGDYRNLHGLINDGAWTRVWDDETRVPWLLAPDRKAVIGYDDAESVRIKTEWAVEKGLRGVFFWQVAGDRLADGSNPLQEASRKALDEGVSRAKAAK